MAFDAVGPGGAFELRAAPKGQSRESGYAATQVTACLCPVERVDVGVADVRVARDYVGLQRRLVRRLERFAEARARGEAKSQLAAVLCAIADEVSGTGSADLIPAGVQQSDMALLIGVRHETISRLMREFSRSQFLRRTKDGVQLLDRAALDAL